MGNFLASNPTIGDALAKLIPVSVVQSMIEPCPIDHTDTRTTRIPLWRGLQQREQRD